MEKKASRSCKQKPREVKIWPYNTVILKHLKSNANSQFATGVYEVLTYIKSYFCKPENAVSELMKKASKETYAKYIKDKMNSVGNIFLINICFYTWSNQRSIIFTYETFKHGCSVFYYLSKKTIELESLSILENMHLDDGNVFASNTIDKYLTEAASSYVSK